MKNCTYCGRENADQAAHCMECGTELVVKQAASPRRDYKWVKVACSYIGGAVLVVLLYLLSFGPVRRYTGTVISRSATTNATGFAVQMTITYPKWVGVVYHPIFSITSQGQSGLGGFYGQYLHAWDESPR